VSKLAREFVTVELTGDGGDEIFGGYTHYQNVLSRERIPAGVRFLAAQGAALLPDGLPAQRRLRALGRDLATRFVQTGLRFAVDARPALYDPAYYAQVRDHDPCQRQLSLFWTAAHLDPVARMQYVDAHMYLSDDILVKVDKASMLTSLETRAPLLDQNLVTYVSSLPSAVRTRNGTLKYLLKKIAADLLPTAILTRGKQGFGIPLQRWFHTDWTGYARHVLESPRARQRGIFQPQFIRHLLHAHAQSRTAKYGEAIWALLCLELWFQVYMDPDLNHLGGTMSTISPHVACRGAPEQEGRRIAPHPR
jgi:asparagine synthase (glutamine-hydrolysing)